MIYFVSKTPTPVLNKADFFGVFGGVAGSLPFDGENLVRALEMIAFPGTVFEIMQEHPSHILEVRTAEYPTLRPLFLDERFGKKEKNRPPEREKKLPPVDVILKRLKSQVSKPYIWGGNVCAGIPELLKYYPPEKKLTDFESTSWTCSGVDCSGLLYEATNGALPRNTQDLLFVGESVPIQNLSWEEIPQILQPLDLLIWKGHMVIVYDEKLIIESKHEWGGVTMTGLEKRLKHIRKVDQKSPADDPIHVLQNRDKFLIRRIVT